jgi:hypothetical protein
MEDVMMIFAPSNAIDKSQARVPSFGGMIWLTSVALLIVFVIAIYLASQAPGTSADELASILSVFP